MSEQFQLQYSLVGKKSAKNWAAEDVEILEDVFDNTKDRIHCPFGDFEPCVDEDIRSVAEMRALSFLKISPVLPDSFLSWFAGVCSIETEAFRSSWHTNVTSGGAHIFLTLSKILHSDKEIWQDVQVIGNYFQDDSISYRDGLLNLLLLARQVFIDDPLRFFLYGLYIRRSHLELWMFDRSGIWCCQAFNIQDEPGQFLSLIFSFQLMADRDLGRCNIIQNDENGNFVMLDKIFQSSLQKLYLDYRTIASSDAIVGQGTTCYRARLADSDRWDYVVKFAWRAKTKRPEEEIFKLAMNKKVWGILSLHYNKSINSTANLRRSLKFGPYRGLLCTDENKEHDITQHTKVTQTQFENRELVCIVTSPAGRRLDSFTTRLELLLAMRDAIRAHRSLLQDARILHQDISPGNIIIVSTQVLDKPHGILIDLDVSMNLDVGPQSNGEVVGTRPFMSIGILHSRRHTYRHDLESFLYVLIWLLIVKDKGSPPPGSRLKMWNRGTWKESADDKEHDMAEANFGRMILSEFPAEYESLKPLAERMRSLLFPIENGKLWTGTDGSIAATNALYDGLISAFEDAVLREKTLAS